MRTPGSKSKPVSVTCPPGMRSDSPEALDVMLRTRGVVLVIDGYNVTMSAWGDAELSDQRERLINALARLHLRLRCDVVVVFDGADVEVAPSSRRNGVRVVFSAAGEDADPVVVREVAGLSPKLPAVVVSSDQWVREQSERRGAMAVPAAALIELLRR
jgi:predicted RNA-binding protein with PIN domain